ncbi:MAG TPA: hypothetical protein VL133_10245 [Devosia sp.]|nr:hypothetical protein [Devosia sp.]
MWFVKLLLGGPLDRVLSSLDKSVDNETERQRIAGDIISKYVAADADTRAAAMQSRIFWYVWALFAIPIGFWLGAIAVDSVFFFSGHIADLPPSVKPYATQIIASIFGSGGAVAGIQAVASAIRGRK